MSTDTPLRIDLDALNVLKVREIIELEEITGTPVTELISAGKPMGKTLQAIAYVMAKRERPDISMDDALELEIVLEQPEGDPTTAAG